MRIFIYKFVLKYIFEYMVKISHSLTENLLSCIHKSLSNQLYNRKVGEGIDHC